MAEWEEEILEDTQEIKNTKQHQFGKVELISCAHTGDTTGLYTRESDGCQMEITPGRTVGVMKVAADEFMGVFPSGLSPAERSIMIAGVWRKYNIFEGYKTVFTPYGLYQWRTSPVMRELKELFYHPDPEGKNGEWRHMHNGTIMSDEGLYQWLEESIRNHIQKIDG